jgi:hypothetical protein
MDFIRNLLTLAPQGGQEEPAMRGLREQFDEQKKADEPAKMVERGFARYQSEQNNQEYIKYSPDFWVRFEASPERGQKAPASAETTGWKMHVSASTVEAQEALAKLAVEMGISKFKFASEVDSFLNQDYKQSGKTAVFYHSETDMQGNPIDWAKFAAEAERIVQENGGPGPVVQRDARIDGTEAVFYRNDRGAQNEDYVARDGITVYGQKNNVSEDQLYNLGNEPDPFARVVVQDGKGVMVPEGQEPPRRSTGREDYGKPPNALEAVAQEILGTMQMEGRIVGGLDGRDNLMVRLVGEPEELASLQKLLDQSGIKSSTRFSPTVNSEVLQVKMSDEKSAEAIRRLLPTPPENLPNYYQPRTTEATRRKMAENDRATDQKLMADFQNAEPDALAKMDMTQYARAALRENIRDLEADGKLLGSRSGANNELRIAGDTASLQQMKSALAFAGVDADYIVTKNGDQQLIVEGQNLQDLLPDLPQEMVRRIEGNELPRYTAEEKAAARKAATERVVEEKPKPAVEEAAAPVENEVPDVMDNDARALRDADRKLLQDVENNYAKGNAMSPEMFPGLMQVEGREMFRKADAGNEDYRLSSPDGENVLRLTGPLNKLQEAAMLLNRVTGTNLEVGIQTTSANMMRPEVVIDLSKLTPEQKAKMAELLPPEVNIATLPEKPGGARRTPAAPMAEPEAAKPVAEAEAAKAPADITPRAYKAAYNAALAAMNPEDAAKLQGDFDVLIDTQKMMDKLPVENQVIQDVMKKRFPNYKDSVELLNALRDADARTPEAALAVLAEKMPEKTAPLPEPKPAPKAVEQSMRDRSPIALLSDMEMEGRTTPVGRPGEYDKLFKADSPEEAAKVAKALKDIGIPEEMYRIGDEGVVLKRVAVSAVAMATDRFDVQENGDIVRPGGQSIGDDKMVSERMVRANVAAALERSMTIDALADVVKDATLKQVTTTDGKQAKTLNFKGDVVPAAEDVLKKMGLQENNDYIKQIDADGQESLRIRSGAMEEYKQELFKAEKIAVSRARNAAAPEAAQDTPSKPRPRRNNGPDPGDMNKRYANGGTSEFRNDPIMGQNENGEMIFRDLTPEERVRMKQMMEEDAAKKAAMEDRAVVQDVAPRTADGPDVPARPMNSPDAVDAPARVADAPSAPTPNIDERAAGRAGTAFALAGLGQRAESISKNGVLSGDGAAAGLDTLGLMQNNVGTSAGLFGNLLGAGINAKTGYDQAIAQGQTTEEAQQKAAIEGAKGIGSSVLTAEVLATGSTLQSIKATGEVAKSIPGALRSTPAAIKNTGTILKETSAAVKGAVNLKNAAGALKGAATLKNGAALAGGVGKMAGGLGLANSAIEGASELIAYQTGEKEDNYENRTASATKTVLALDPLKAVTGLANLTKLAGVDTGIQNVSMSSLADRAMGGKGEDLGEMIDEVNRTYDAENKRFQSGEIDKQFRRVDEKGTLTLKDGSTMDKPLMSDYKHLAAVKFRVAKAYQERTGRPLMIDGKNVTTEFNEIDMSKPENYRKYRSAINMAMVQNEKIMEENSSYVPRWLRSGDSMDKYNNAESEINILKAAEGEFRSFETKTIAYNREKEKVLEEQKIAEAEAAKAREAQPAAPVQGLAGVKTDEKATAPMDDKMRAALAQAAASDGQNTGGSTVPGQKRESARGAGV